MRTIAPLDKETILASVRKTAQGDGRLRGQPHLRRRRRDRGHDRRGGDVRPRRARSCGSAGRTSRPCRSRQRSSTSSCRAGPDHLYRRCSSSPASEAAPRSRRSDASGQPRDVPMTPRTREIRRPTSPTAGRAGATCSVDRGGSSAAARSPLGVLAFGARRSVSRRRRAAPAPIRCCRRSGSSSLIRRARGLSVFAGSSGAGAGARPRARGRGSLPGARRADAGRHLHAGIPASEPGRSRPLREPAGRAAPRLHAEQWRPTRSCGSQQIHPEDRDRVVAASDARRPRPASRSRIEYRITSSPTARSIWVRDESHRRPARRRRPPDRSSRA